MPLGRRFYELSPQADQDISKIFDYSVDGFGVKQAVFYLSQFDELFEQLIDNPELGRERPEIRAKLRSIAQESHVVFYRILKDRIRIVRVLHGSRDIAKLL